MPASMHRRFRRSNRGSVCAYAYQGMAEMLVRPANSRSKRFRRSLVTMAAVQANKPGVRHHLERDETLGAALE